MAAPLQISFRHMDPSPSMETHIRALMARLERFSAHILRCHVIIETPHQHHEQGNLFDVRIEAALPGGEIAIHRTHAEDHAHEDPYVALRDAFRALRRKLQDFERKRRHSVHAP